MENASKALIIAGAILLAIVIISLGLIVVNNTRGTVDSANLSEQEIQTFNAKFTAYEGTKVSGTRVNTLIQAVIASNEGQKKAGSTNYVEITVSSGTYDSSGTASTDEVNYDENSTTYFKANTGKSYKVTLTYTKSLISGITIANAN